MFSTKGIPGNKNTTFINTNVYEIPHHFKEPDIDLDELYAKYNVTAIESQFAIGQTTINLDATFWIDGVEAELNYGLHSVEWVQISGPTVEITNKYTLHASFINPNTADMVFQCNVYLLKNIEYVISCSQSVNNSISDNFQCNMAMLTYAIDGGLTRDLHPDRMHSTIDESYQLMLTAINKVKSYSVVRTGYGVNLSG